MERRTFLEAMAAAAVATGSQATAHEQQEQDQKKADQPNAADQAGQSSGVLERRPLGRTGEQVSIIGLGGFHIGTQKEERDSIHLIRAAIDGGITFMDNCWDYNDGASENRMGKALKEGYRQKVFLMTKIDGRTKKAAAEQLDQSLRRLQTDMIDLVQHHEIIRLEDPDRVFAEGGANEALVEARQAGKIRFIGFTGHKDPLVHLRMLDMADEHGFAFDTVQMPLNVMDAHFRSFTKLVLPRLVERGIGVLGMKSMASGIILKTQAVTPEECLQFALSLPTATVITGIDSQEILEQNLRIARNFKPLNDAQIAALLDKTAKLAATGKYEPFKTRNIFDGTALHPEWLGPA
jgi:aryl-alcohol dehydrogenase-like predicted oxidoreductase